MFGGQKINLGDMFNRGNRAGGGGLNIQKGWTPPESQRSAGGQAGGGGAGSPAARAAVPSGFSDYEWFLAYESAAFNGLAAVNTIDGWPNTYTKVTHGWQFDKGRGRPYVRGGFGAHLTKGRAWALSFSQSWGADKQIFFPGRIHDIMEPLCDPPFLPCPGQEGENLLVYGDNANTNEATGCGVLVVYGNPGHAYPSSLEEILKIGGIGGKARNIWCPQATVTAGGAGTPGSGTTALGSCTVGTKWLSSDSYYYIIGAMPHNVASSAGALEFAGNLPGFYKERQALIPIGNATTAMYTGEGLCLPYEPIGPFSGTALPNEALFSVAAAAHLHGLYLAEL